MGGGYGSHATKQSHPLAAKILKFCIPASQLHEELGFSWLLALCRFPTQSPELPLFVGSLAGGTSLDLQHSLPQTSEQGSTWAPLLGSIKPVNYVTLTG